jgi:phospholipid-transporting ATPase
MLYEFKGSLEGVGETPISIDNDAFVLRGCMLRNTDYIIGVVSFVGHYSKIMKNSVKAKPKKSDLEQQLNIQIIFVFLALIAFCSISSGLYIVWYSVNKN